MRLGTVHPCAACGYDIQTVSRQYNRWPISVDAGTGHRHKCATPTEPPRIVGCDACLEPVIVFANEYRDFRLGYGPEDMPVHRCGKAEVPPEPAPAPVKAPTKVEMAQTGPRKSLSLDPRYG